MRASLPGRVPDWPVATVRSELSELVGWLGPAHDFVDDSAQVPGPTHFWFFTTADGLEVVVECADVQGLANLHALPPVPSLAVRGLGIPAERVIWTRAEDDHQG